jgi:hypothetical protein
MTKSRKPGAGRKPSPWGKSRAVKIPEQLIEQVKILVQQWKAQFK